MSTGDVSGSGLRLLNLLEALCGYAANGATNTDLAHAVKTSAPNVTRGMAVLIAKGWARKSEDSGRFYPTTQYTRQCFRVLDDFERLENRISDTKRSMTGR
jgi:DNA-binding IclR family transcriptional regulator